MDALVNTRGVNIVIWYIFNQLLDNSCEGGSFMGRKLYGWAPIIYNRTYFLAPIHIGARMHSEPDPVPKIL